MSSFADPSPIAVALDAPDLSGAVEIAQQVSTSVSTFKVGLELYMRYGPEAVHAIAAAAPGRKLFLDVKLHDIPNTVGGAGELGSTRHHRASDGRCSSPCRASCWRRSHRIGVFASRSGRCASRGGGSDTVNHARCATSWRRCRRPAARGKS